MQRKPLRRDARDSRDRLILTAERLFAERGIDGVSLRARNLAAGQKNVSGLQYHFGTKAGLLAAVFGYRVPEIEARRQAKLVKQRLGLQVGHFVHALADLEGRVVRQGRPVTPKRIQLFVNDLLNTAIGALTAPVSPATTVLL